jgi:hypothetical protein
MGHSKLFNPHPMCQYESPMVLSCDTSHLSHGHGVLDHGTFQLFNPCPMGHCASPMGPLTCSAAAPWATVNSPWSCPLPHCICPMGIVYWTMGHSSSSPSVQWATVNPPWDMSTSCPLSHGHVALDHGTYLLFNISPMGHCESPMVLLLASLHLSHGHSVLDNGMFKLLVSGPMGQCKSPMVLSCVSHIRPMGLVDWTMGHCVSPMVLSVPVPHLHGPS